MPDENQIEQEEAIISHEEPAFEQELDDTEDVEAIRAESERMKLFAQQTLARAKKAEEENKLLKKPKSEPANTHSQASIEETVLLANGMAEELLNELKVIAQVRGVSLIKAQADPLFVAAKEILERDKKQKEASMPASRGSGSSKPKKDFSSPGLSRDEHKAMFMNSNL